MKRILALALLGTTFAAGVARAEYDEYTNAHRQAVRSLQFEPGIQQTPLEVQTGYNP